MSAATRVFLVLLGSLVMYTGCRILIEALIIDWLVAVLSPIGIWVIMLGFFWVKRVARMP